MLARAKGRMTTLVLRCPACTTAFRVADEQLRLRQGLVRCGVCQTVFNGWEHLEDEAVAASTDRSHSPRQPAAPGNVARPGRVEPAVGSGRVHAVEDDDPVVRADPRIGQVGAREPVVRLGGYEAHEPALRSIDIEDEPSWQEAGEDRIAPERDHDAVLSATRTGDDGPPHRVGGTVPDAEPSRERRRRTRHRYEHEPYAEARYTDPRYRDKRYAYGIQEDADAGGRSRSGRSARHRSGRRRSRFMTLVWRAGIMLGLVLLLVQLVVWWRTPIATYAPAFRPALVAMCEALGCVVGHVRSIDYLSIEGSSLQPAVDGPRGRGERYVLEAVLRNRAPHPQPWPVLEVNLTDHSDVVVVRKALRPEEYLTGAALEGPFPANSEQSIAVELEKLNNIPVTGYRLELYFP